VKEDYRKSYRVFLVLFLFSLSVNLVLLVLYFEKRIPWGSFLKERKSDREWQQGRLAEGMVPDPVVHVKPQEHFLLCEKNARLLHLFRSEADRFDLMKSYPCIVGLNDGDKRKVGDLATPEGIYFLVSFLSNLPEKYGAGAFSLNYPNFIDQKEGKKGSGIWLHGFPNHMERPLHSEGCVVVKDEDLKELMGFIKTGDTPIVIVDATRYQSPEDQQKVFQRLRRFLKGWKEAWESLDTEQYLTNSHCTRNRESR
jgi:murein L,D-transpeptidase YafK